jgi:hypothetical protein
MVNTQIKNIYLSFKKSSFHLGIYVKQFFFQYIHHILINFLIEMYESI